MSSLTYTRGLVTSMCYHRDCSYLNVLLRDIARLREDFDSCRFIFVRRQGNLVSHSVAKFASKLKYDVTWGHCFPHGLTKNPGMM